MARCYPHGYCCGGCPTCLGAPSVFFPAAPPQPTGPTMPAQPMPRAQQTSLSTVRQAAYETPAPQFGGFVNPYAADPYAPNPNYAPERR
jgi:hypothetical protein